MNNTVKDTLLSIDSSNIRCQINAGYFFTKLIPDSKEPDIFPGKVRKCEYQEVKKENHSQFRQPISSKKEDESVETLMHFVKARCKEK